jgi:hypothetical protein
VNLSKLNALCAVVLFLALVLSMLRSASAATAYEEALAECGYLNSSRTTLLYLECLHEELSARRYFVPQAPIYVVQPPPAHNPYLSPPPPGSGE